MQKLPPAQLHSPTSLEAAARAQHTAATKRGEIFRLIVNAGDFGATDEEIQVLLRIAESTERPRRGELVAAGLIVDSGQTRPTTRNRPATVWIDARRRQTAQRSLF